MMQLIDNFLSEDKRERPARWSLHRDAAFLSQCSEREARDWLKSRPVEFSPVFGTPRTPPESHVLEYILYRRGLPLIDLALAEHGRSGSVLKRLYRRGNPHTRVVACANASLFYGDSVPGISSTRIATEVSLLLRIVEQGPLNELRAVCENPNLDRGFYAGLVTCWEGENDARNARSMHVSSDRFKVILYSLSRNPWVATKVEPFRLDITEGLDHLKFFTRCWHLATVVPVERDWAYVLGELYKQLNCYTDHFEDLNAVLSRWRTANETSDSLSYNPFAVVREHIAAKFFKPSIDMLNHEDEAIRQAFYRTFDPERPEFRELDWNNWLERDDWCDLWLMNNLNIWQSAWGRSKLRGLCWAKKRVSHDGDEAEWFSEMEKRYRQTKPEWFEDDEEPEEIEDQPDRIGNLESAFRNFAQANIERRSTNMLWFLLVAFIGSMIGAAIW